MRARGLTPSAPVTVEASPPGTGAWTTVASGTATAAGTASLPITVATTSDYRVVSGAAASAPVTVVGAVAPQPPVGVVATPTGRGQVTVTWQPPVDTGGAPLTQYAVRVDGKRVVAPAGAASAVVSGVRAGSRVATVRAFNEVAMSAWATAAVAVPAYPSVTGPTRAKKRSTVTLALAGLLPGQPVSVAVTTVKSGKVATRSLTAGADGRATVKVTVRSTVRVVASSGGVRSAAHRIGVP